MINTLAEYVEGVLESESTEQRDWRAPIPTKLYRVNHALTGLITEIAELIEVLYSPDPDWVNIKEELGDAWWYVGLCCAALNLIPAFEIPELEDSVPHQRIMSGQSVLTRLTRSAGESFDVIKRRIYYFAEELPDGHEKKAKAVWSKVDVTELVVILGRLTTTLGFDVREVWTLNLLKLIGPEGRYAGKFDPDKALHRNLVAEREVLEGGEENARAD